MVKTLNELFDLVLLKSLLHQGKELLVVSRLSIEHGTEDFEEEAVDGRE